MTAIAIQTWVRQGQKSNSAQKTVQLQCTEWSRPTMVIKQKPKAGLFLTFNQLPLRIPLARPPLHGVNQSI
ncbi:hypothetical protein PCANC_21959 [Puccinia coronata f. sp. avenae]|uniref:Uncharacterized protein n=1 Tax=Puccinia coronata f. sp. avenae TaxID=200324 RepID=A0A2N5U5G5_9BASI|nr:hypothetical protein PCANC_21959 [Puccinia coronata f. sp. avenae]